MKIKSKKEKLKNMRFDMKKSWLLNSAIFAFLIFNFYLVPVNGQEQPPAPTAPKSIKIPAIKQKELRNGLTVAVAEKRGLPLVTIRFQTGVGSNADDSGKSGTANLTAGLLTKGTKTRTATQIAQSIEALGGSISSGATFETSVVSVTVTSDKVNQAMAILADVVLNPKFAQSEIDLLKKQTVDDLTYQMTQPGNLAGFVTGLYTFHEYPGIGTVESLKSIDRQSILEFYKEYYQLQDAVLIFAGDISEAQATALAQRYFSRGAGQQLYLNAASDGGFSEKPVKNPPDKKIVKRMLVIDLPDSGQAAVTYAKRFDKTATDWDEKKGVRRYGKEFFSGNVLNSLLGGGYSSRLNQEIRIKRGLSYGAGSAIQWRSVDSNFFARTQTKNVSAAEVAELIVEEVERLIEDSTSEKELNPRKSVLTGDFSRELETTAGLANMLGELYSERIDPNELNTYMEKVRGVDPATVREFAAGNLSGGDLIIVGDYKVFREDLAKRFPNMRIEVIKAGDLVLSRDQLIR